MALFSIERNETIDRSVIHVIIMRQEGTIISFKDLGRINVLCHFKAETFCN